MSLTDKFLELLDEIETRPEAAEEARDLVFNAEQNSEREALMAMIYHDGIGVEADMEKSFYLAELSAFMGHQSLGYYLLGCMCDDGDTPDQRDGGPQQKYDHYDAERFFEICSKGSKPWSDYAHLWLGDYYMNMARGGDPEFALEHYEAIGHEYADAAGKLSDYYFEQLDYDLNRPEEERDELLEDKVFEWTKVAYDLDPEEYSYSLGSCYFDGIGCEADFGEAMKYWEESYNFGDWRAAEGISMIYDEQLELIKEDSEYSENDYYNCEMMRDKWRELARIGREEEAAGEYDDVIEED